MKTYLVDANIFLRLLLNDVPAQTNKAKKVITKAKEGKIKLVTSQIIIFEVVFALSKYFDFPKAKVALALEYIIESQYFNLESKKDFYVALNIFRNKNIDFTDSFLLARKINSKVDIFSFDKKLNNYAKDIKTY